MIQTIGASLNNLEHIWTAAEKQAARHTEAMRRLYNTKLKLSGWSPSEGGWLHKPDFKKCKNIKQWHEHRGLLKYQKRWFVLREGSLTYYKSDPKHAKTNWGRSAPKPKGAIILNNILQVRPSLAPKAPEFSLDVLMSTGEVYILGCETAQEQMCWAVHLTRQSKCPTDPMFVGVV